MPFTGTSPDYILKDISIESKNTKFGVLTKELCKLQAMKKICSISEPTIVETTVALNYIWINSRLKGLSIESKNV